MEETGKKSDVAVAEALLSVEVVEKPQFTNLLKDVKVSMGRPVQFQVEAIGKPLPVITWLKDNFAIAPSPEYQVRFLIKKKNQSFIEVFISINNH